MASTSKNITLKSLDGETFYVDEAVVVELQTIKRMIEDDGTSNEIPLPNVTSKILSKVIEYCKKHAAADKDDDLLKTWDANFVKVDHTTLFDLIRAANYLDIKSLLDLTCQAVVDIVKGKKPEENNFIPVEEEEEDHWAFE